MSVFTSVHPHECIHMIVSTWVYPHECIHMSVFTWVYPHECIHKSVFIWVYPHECIHMSVFIWVYPHECIHMRVFTWVYPQRWVYPHECIHMRVSTKMSVSGFRPWHVPSWDCVSLFQDGCYKQSGFVWRSRTLELGLHIMAVLMCGWWVWLRRVFVWRSRTLELGLHIMAVLVCGWWVWLRRVHSRSAFTVKRAQRGVPKMKFTEVWFMVWEQCICRVGQNRIYTPYVTAWMVISLPKTLYIHRIYQ